MNYPKREAFFAHKFVRLMHKAAVAAEIGRDAFSLLVVVAHTEDAMRYRGPAKFWNSQLIETMGFAKWDQFDKARSKAIHSGWLQYSGDGKRTSGEYFVTIPDGYEQISDSPIEETCTLVNPENGYDRGYKKGYDRGYKEGYDRGMIEGTNRVQSGVQTGYEQGEPSVPSPTPVPDLYTPGRDIVIPEHINTEQFREIVGRFVNYTRASSKTNGKPIESNSMEEQELWRMVGTWKVDADSLSEAVSAAIVGGWANLRKPAGTKAYAKFTKFSGEFVEAIKAAQQYPTDYETRLKILGEHKFEALKRTGTAKVADAKDSQLQALGEVYDSHLKDIRNGITASN
jgi:hypothetical protein